MYARVSWTCAFHLVEFVETVNAVGFDSAKEEFLRVYSSYVSFW